MLPLDLLTCRPNHAQRRQLTATPTQALSVHANRLSQAILQPLPHRFFHLSLASHTAEDFLPTQSVADSFPVLLGVSLAAPFTAASVSIVRMLASGYVRPCRRRGSRISRRYMLSAFRFSASMAAPYTSTNTKSWSVDKPCMSTSAALSSFAQRDNRPLRAGDYRGLTPHMGNKKRAMPPTTNAPASYPAQRVGEQPAQQCP